MDEVSWPYSIMREHLQNGSAQILLILSRRAMRLCTAISWLMIVICAPLYLHAQASKPSEYDVEAAYLYNFGKFVQWPAETHNATFTICVLGDDSFEAKVETVVGNEAVNGRATVVKKLPTAREAAKCQVLFVSSREQEHMERDLKEIGSSPVLTVSDAPDFTRHGGMIGFVLQSRKVRFEVNMLRAQKVGLQLSSELLKVAVNVVGSPRAGDRK